MKIQHRNHHLATTLLVSIANITIAWIATPASAHSLVTTYPKLDFSITSSEILVRATDSNSAQFMQEQLHPSGSNISTPLQQDVWSQPIGWLFGLTFVLLGSVIAWSKYTRNR